MFSFIIDDNVIVIIMREMWKYFVMRTTSFCTIVVSFYFTGVKWEML